MAAYVNIFADQGADFSSVISINDIRKDPIDLTFYTLTGQIRRTYTSRIHYDFDIEVIDLEVGQFIIHLGSDITSEMKYGRYVYDIFAERDAGGERYKLLEGIFELIPSTTKKLNTSEQPESEPWQDP